MLTSLILIVGVLAIVVTRILLTRPVDSGNTPDPVLGETTQVRRGDDELAGATL